MAVLKKYFGAKPGQTGVQFLEETKKLADDEKLELARLAAKQLELTQSDVSFQFTKAE